MSGRAILYARVSTRAQAEEGYSLRQQLEAGREWARREGYKVIDEITDEGYSGATLDRPGLDRLRDMAAEADVVWAQDRDRWSREPALLWLLGGELEERGVRMLAGNDAGVAGPEGDLQRGIYSKLHKY